MYEKKYINERFFHNDEMTLWGFISHLEGYIKQLLKDPSKANVDKFLEKHGIDNETALKILLKTDGSDPNSSILIKTTSIRPDKESGEVSEDGKSERPKDVFHIRYKLPRKDYSKKMRNLYINLFESNINEELNYNEMLLSSTPNPFKDKKFGKVQSQCPPGTTGDRLAKYVNDNENEYEEKLKIDEGAWGKGPLDNDSALDSQNEFGKICLRILYNRTKIASDSDSLWSNLGVFIDFVKKYKDNELHFTDEYTDAISFIRVKLAQLLNDDAWLQTWDEPKEMMSSLKKLYKDVSSYQYHKDIMSTDRTRGVIDPTMSLGEGKVNECDGGDGGTMDGVAGATNAESSGQFLKPMTKKPIRRKTMYITAEQEKFLKNKLNEDSPNVMDTQAGDFGYDAPASICSDDDPALDHKNMMKKSWRGR